MSSRLSAKKSFPKLTSILLC